MYRNKPPKLNNRNCYETLFCWQRMALGHDCVAAGQQELISLLYATIKVEQNSNGKPEAVGYAPTILKTDQIIQRLIKLQHMHTDKSSKNLLALPHFESFIKSGSNVKPIIIFTVDGGPDENPDIEML